MAQWNVWCVDKEEFFLDLQTLVPEAQEREGCGDFDEPGVEAGHAASGQKIRLYSSNNAIGFYLNMGFRQTGPGIDRPGGCLPFEYEL